nr:hypothetical protein Itr_chr02CG24550 [Ipomoea trifida]
MPATEEIKTMHPDPDAFKRGRSIADGTGDFEALSRPFLQALIQFFFLSRTVRTEKKWIIVAVLGFLEKLKSRNLSDSYELLVSCRAFMGPPANKIALKA